jgi:tetratricopeptide (TPR) repeat protein
MKRFTAIKHLRVLIFCMCVLLSLSCSSSKKLRGGGGDYELLMQQVSELAESGDIIAAMPLLKRMHEIRPSELPPVEILGNVYAIISDRSDMSDALFWLLKAQEMGSQNGDIYYNLARVYSVMRELEKSIEALGKAFVYESFSLAWMAKDDDLENLRATAWWREFEAELVDKLIQIFTEAIKRDPQDADAYNARGVTYSGQGEFDRAIDDFTWVIRLRPDDAEAYNMRAMSYSDKEDFDRAIEDFTQIIRLRPNDANAYLMRAMSYWDKKEFNRAIEDLTNAIGIDPDFADAYHVRGMVYSDKGEVDRAMEDMTKAVQLASSSYMSKVRIEMYRQKGEFDRALDIVNLAIQVDTSDAHLYYIRGAIYYHKKEYGKAVEDYTKVIRLDPNLKREGYNDRGIVYDIMGEYDKAIEDFARSISLSGGPSWYEGYCRAMSHNNRGLAFMRKGDYEGAIADFAEAVRIDSSNFIAYNGMAVTYAKTGDFGKASENAKKSLKTAEAYSDLNAIFALSTSVAAELYKRAPYLSGDSLGSQSARYYAQTARDAVSLSVRRAEHVRSTQGARGSAVMAQALYLYYMGVDIEARFGDIAKAFEYSESLRSRGFLKQMGTEAALRLPDITAEERGNILGLRRQIERTQSELDAFRENPLKIQEESDRYVTAGQNLSRLENELAAADAAIAIRLSKKDKNLAARYAELRNPKPKSLTEAREWCGADKAVLEFALWDNTIDYKPVKILDLASIDVNKIVDARPTVNPYCIVITKDTAVAVPIDPNFDYAGAVGRIRSEIKLENNRYSNFIADMEEDRNALYNALIKPALPHIPKNIKNLTIVPDGALGILPFDILRENDKSKDLGETYRVTISPSLSVSMLRQEDAARKLPIMAFGGAWYSRHKTLAERERPTEVASAATGTRGAVLPDGKLDLDVDWNDLDNSGTEVENLRALVPSPNDIKIVLGRDVSEANIKRLSAQGDLAKYPILHFAVHGHFAEGDAGQASIVLSEVSGLLGKDEDGYLTMPEIVQLNLDAQMVMLSACHTGMADTKRGDGMVGLTRAFMVTGVDNIGVSLWEIDDAATMEFMTRIYTKVLKTGLTFREAYYQTKNEYRRHKEWSFPFYWAPFVIYE